MKTRFLIHFGTLLIAVLLTEAAPGLSGQSKKFDPREIAMIYNDPKGLHLKTAESIASQWERDPGAEAVKILAGHQLLTFDLWQYAGGIPGYESRYWTLKEPIKLTGTIISGHRYQVVTLLTEDKLNLIPLLVDITTQDDVWKYYEMGHDRFQAVKFLTKAERLKEIAQSDVEFYVRIKAIEKISDEAFLTKLESEETNEQFRESIRERLAKIRK